MHLSTCYVTSMSIDATTLCSSILYALTMNKLHIFFTMRKHAHLIKGKQIRRNLFILAYSFLAFDNLHPARYNSLESILSL